MLARSRERSFTFGSGTAVPNQILSPVTATMIRSEWCEDVIGNYPNPNPFDLLLTYNKLWQVTGRNRNYSTFWNCTSFPAITNSSFPWLGSTSTGPSDNAALAEGLAKTNPNRPVVDLPILLFELRDLPRMLQDWGGQIAKTRMMVRSRGSSVDVKYISRRSASNFLSWEFAIKPFLSDLAKMLDFQAHVDKRVNALKKLGSGATVRSATVWQDVGIPSSTVNQHVTTLSSEFNRVNYVRRTERKRWVSTKWKPLSPLPDTDAELRKLAVRLVFGLDISFATLWEAMPWSWLIDWFTNVGDIVNGARNTIPVSHSGTCIMRYSRTHIEILGFTEKDVGCTYVVTPSPSSNEQKVRVLAPSVALPEFSLPFLDGRQLSILSALAVSKR